jgi:hypothetical protein
VLRLFGSDRGGQFLSSGQFRELMERWQVPDQVALDLIGYGGKSGRSGKRPRFRFITRQQRITECLIAIAVISGWGSAATRSASASPRLDQLNIHQPPLR